MFQLFHNGGNQQPDTMRLEIRVVLEKNDFPTEQCNLEIPRLDVHKEQL